MSGDCTLLQKCQPKEGQHDCSILLVIDITATVNQEDCLLVEANDHCMPMHMHIIAFWKEK
jgi:hypothetical protein